MGFPGIDFRKPANACDMFLVRSAELDSTKNTPGTYDCYDAIFTASSKGIKCKYDIALERGNRSR